ncbi:MAG: heme lyase CcmF/NrfE family subunit [Chromatiales bacterium]|nr:heme lyase CcmF/NrfE family subunit [Chromatiales bacterium]
MWPELGQICLIIALCLAICQAFFPLVGAQTGRAGWMAIAVPAAAGQLVFVAIAYAILTAAFIQHDFSVWYVAANSNTQLPLIYRITAVWGGHEGSLVLWALVLAIWTAAVAAFSRQLPVEMSSRILGVMGIISIGFLSFTLFTSNPFERLWPIPIDGRDLNPLLQDPAMALHPPMLYMGYVGFAVAFGFAAAALLAGRVDQAWARWARPWTIAAWTFLTIGIALGSWWAYYELGWGGWWFWDPVENASFMPWLVGTALIHSLAVTEKRGLFKGTTLLLAIAAFSFSLLGTFLVRSGVLVSVHSFASDPSRGLFILVFLTLVVGAALMLYAWRAPTLDRAVGFQPLSRESFLLVNNVLLCVATGLILLGTLYPLFLDALNMGKISVGPPYFDIAFIIPMLPLLLFVGIGMHTAWRSFSWTPLWRRLRWIALLALVAGIALPWAVYGSNSVLTGAGVIAAAWLIGTALIDPVRSLLGRGPRITRGAAGMLTAHFGLGIFVLGVTVVSSFDIETDQRIGLGETVAIGDYEVTFRAIRPVRGPNFDAMQAEMAISRDGQPVGTVFPEKRVYFVQTAPMTEAGIHSRMQRDVFVALGDDLGANAWSFRLQYKPLISFLWLGSAIMALGGLVAMTDRRYRVPVAAPASAAGGPVPARVPALPRDPRA